MTADDPRPAGEACDCILCATTTTTPPPAFRPAASGGATDGEREEHARLDDEYVKPRYPVDEPPTYRARCTCGWTGPERYRGITDGDWQQHIPVASQADGELREEIAEALCRHEFGAEFLDEQTAEWQQHLREGADAVLALPAVQRLLADAAKVQRVRDVMSTWHRGWPVIVSLPRLIDRALDSDS